MKNEIKIPNNLLAFTFFFAVVIYVLLLGFIFWDKHKTDEV